MAELRNIADKRVGFEQIYRDYSKPMFLYALSFLTSEEEAEDVIQEVFVNFWKDETYRKVKGEVTKTYLFRSVKNNCLNRLKKKDVLRDRLDLLREDIVEEEIMKWNDELIQEVESEIDRMPEQTKLIIRGVFFREMKYQEVADELGISVATVNSILVRALKKLRQQADNKDELAIYLFFLEKSLISEQ